MKLKVSNENSYDPSDRVIKFKGGKLDIMRFIGGQLQNSDKVKAFVSAKPDYVQGTEQFMLKHCIGMEVGQTVVFIKSKLRRVKFEIIEA